MLYFRNIAIAALLLLPMNLIAAPRAADSALAGDSPTVEDVPRLVKLLGSDAPSEREDAQKRLERIGAPALPALEDAAEKSDDPELRSRAQAVVADVKDRKANGPSFIKLHVKDASVRAVFEELGAQSQAIITGPDSVSAGRDGGEPTITIDVDQKPFWDVMQSLCSQVGACPALDSPRSSSNRSLRLVRMRDWLETAPHQVVGPYWVGVAGIYRDQSIDLTGPTRYWDQFYIRVAVVPEPKLLTKLVGFAVTEAVDDAGHSLMPAPHALRMPIDPATDSFRLESPLTYPQNAGTKIARLAGEVTILVGQQFQPFVVDDPVGSPKSHSSLSSDAKAVVVALPHGLYSVNIKGTWGVTEQQWSMSDLRLEDAQGRALIPYVNPRTAAGSRTFTRPGHSPGNYSVFGMFMRSAPGGGAGPPVGEPKRLLWNIPTAFKTAVIPVTFTDLPLPGR